MTSPRRPSGPLAAVFATVLPLVLSFALSLGLLVSGPLIAQDPAASDAPAEPGADPETGDARTDDAETGEDDDPTFLEEITVTASRAPRSVSSVAGNVTVVDREEIERRQADGLADLVRYEPGVDVASDPTRLGTSGFIIRGLGGNRVLTRVDGIPTAEQFDFGPLSSPQIPVAVEMLQGVEIVRSAGSSLYGSDALAGVVALETRDPSDFLAGGREHLGLSAGWRGADDSGRASLSGALARGDWSTSLVLDRRDGAERETRGTVDTLDATRTRANPMDWASDGALAKLERQISPANRLVLAAELFDADTETEVYSSRRVQDLRPFAPVLIDTRDFDATDTQRRWRASLEQQLGARGDGGLGVRWFDTLLWRAHHQDSSTEQLTDEVRQERVFPPFGPPIASDFRRLATFSFDQRSTGGEVQLQKALGLDGDGARHFLTWGASVLVDRFETLRTVEETALADGTLLDASATRYFPRSDSLHLGLYVQDEIDLLDGRLRLIPGLRFDSYELDPDRDDRIFLEGNPGQPAPVGLDDSALSPRLGAVARLGDHLSGFAQYSRGFRAPPHSAVNNGFSNLAGGYRTLPNPGLEPETSDTVELGLRGSWSRAAFSLTAFNSRYDDFIETVTLGFNPALGLLEFQPRNVGEVEIEGLELSADLRLSDALRLRTSGAWIEGDNLDDGTPLESVTPPQAVVGLDYVHEGRTRPGDAWGLSLITTWTAAKDDADVAEGQFAAPGYELVDLTGFWRLTPSLRLQAGVFNLLDETYWLWPEVRGRSATAPALERFTSPGRNASITLRWEP